MTSYDDSLDHERRSEREERERDDDDPAPEWMNGLDEQAWCDACGKTVEMVYVSTRGLLCDGCMCAAEVP